MLLPSRDPGFMFTSFPACSALLAAYLRSSKCMCSYIKTDFHSLVFFPAPRPLSSMELLKHTYLPVYLEATTLWVPSAQTPFPPLLTHLTSASLIYSFKSHFLRTSLVVQWLRPFAPNVGGLSLILDHITRSYTPQPKIPRATSETLCCQINKNQTEVIF